MKLADIEAVPAAEFALASPRRWSLILGGGPALIDFTGPPILGYPRGVVRCRALVAGRWSVRFPFAFEDCLQMPSPSRTDPLSDRQLNDLAAAALCLGKDDLWPELQAEIALICLRVCRGGANVADEVTQRTSIKLLRARGTPAGYRNGGNFRAWCSRVAANAQNDVYREAGAGIKTGALDEVDPPARTVFSSFYDDASPMGGEDLDAALALFAEFPEMAVQVFAVSWLWRLLPDGAWAAWLTDPRICIEPPWPPPNVIEQENPRELLLGLTAEAFGITRDSVRKNVERQRSFLLKLARARAIMRYKE